MTTELPQLGGNSVGKSQQLDPEWIGLILEASNLGISIQEIREFIEKEKVHSTNNKEV